MDNTSINLPRGISKKSTLFFLKLNASIIFIVAILVLALGAYVVSGYEQPNFAFWVQKHIVYYPMAYTTGLCFFLTGFALLAAASRWIYITRIVVVLILLEVVIMFLDLFTPPSLPSTCSIFAIENCYYTNLHLRTSVPTAVCFAVTSFALWNIVSVNALRRHWVYFTSVLAVSLAAVSFIFLFGYVVHGNIPFPVSKWFILYAMAANTSVGFLVLAVGLLALSANLGLKFGVEFKKFLPVLSSIFISLISLVFWGDVLQEESLVHLPLKAAVFTICKELGFSVLVGLMVYSSQAAYQQARRARRFSVMAKAILEAVAEGIFVVDIKNRVVGSNKRLLEMWNIPAEMHKETNLKHIQQFVLSQVEAANEFEKVFDQIVLLPGKALHGEVKLNNGNIYEFATYPEQLGDQIIGSVCSFHDITRLKHTEKQLLYQATHDVLTDLPNRFLLFDQIKKAMTLAARNSRQLALLFFDLNHFKSVNDTLGHAMGDLLLQAVSKRLKLCTRATDTLARLGGDEFVLLIVDISTLDDVVTIAERYLLELSEPFSLDGQLLSLNCSLGISVFPNDGSAPETLLKNADLAMYYAKKNRLKMQFYSHNLEEASVQLNFENELYHALKANALVLHYQPIINLKTQKISGTEALIRWNHPTRGLIMPLEFIGLAEESNLIHDLGEWILYAACKQNKVWKDAGILDARINVNVSPLQLKNPEFFAKTCAVLEKLHLDSASLELELTENILVDDFELLKAVMQKFKEVGVNFAMDDFGTGYASFKYLKNLPLNKIKIDKSFVTDVLNVDSERSIVQAILLMAKGMGLEVIAEGVEEKAQLDFLLNNGCQEIQGYYVSPPVSAEEYTNFITNWHFKPIP